ncbi:MAG: hypothetical protein HZB55_04680 [Deltaproteobacteria bacterium]|nr:hypothetical protein [Deltaproteobacteria bacterium]
MTRCRWLAGALALTAGLAATTGRRELYRAYSLAPPVVAANAAALQEKAPRLTGRVRRQGGIALLAGPWGAPLRLADPLGQLRSVADGKEVVLEAVVARSEVRVTAVHHYRGLTRGRVLWSLATVPIIAGLFLAEFRLRGRTFAAR